MSPEDQNRAIALECGWRKTTEGHWITPDNVIHLKLPNYCADLNAIQDAILSKGTYFAWQLAAFMKDGLLGYWGIYASAAQRAEFFLKATDRWVE